MCGELRAIGCLSSEQLSSIQSFLLSEATSSQSNADGRSFSSMYILNFTPTSCCSLQIEICRCDMSLFVVECT